MYIVLTGAKKNLGDYLITERSEALLRELRPERELIRKPSWEPLDLGLAKEAKAAIILGGPGYQPNMYPGVYPLAPDLDDIACPVVPMGLGWKGIPGDDLTLETYRFKPQSLKALRWMERRAPFLGCRDWLTERALRNQGLEKTLMTGCPVWFHLPSRGVAVRRPEQVQKLVFTPPQRSIFAEQSLRIAANLARRWPDAEKIASFHRGIGRTDEWTPPDDARNTQYLARELSALGFAPRDVSGGLEKVAFYAECDLHIGYRVHAHIQFLSERRPSLLLHEDGRGRGASHALAVEGVDAFEHASLRVLAQHVKAPQKLADKLRREVNRRYQASEAAVLQVERLLDADEQTGFARYAGVGARIDAQLEVMKRFLLALP